MIRFKINLVILFTLFLLTVPYSNDTGVKTTKNETALKHSTIVFISSLPLTLTYSLLSYRFYKI